MVHHGVVWPCTMSYTALTIRPQKPSLFHIIFDHVRPHYPSTVRSADMNIPNEVKLWHKAAPVLITVATILGLVVIFQH